MNYPDFHTKYQADEWADEIEECFARYGIKVGVKVHMSKRDHFVIKVKLKGSTRVSQVLKYASDVKFKLKLHTFKPFIKEPYIFITVSERDIQYDRFLKILVSPVFTEAKKKMKLPHIIGTDGMGENIVEDLASVNHLLNGGSSGSGKTIALLILILSIILSKSPQKVNLLIIDVGANDLTPFNIVPHLSCPVIRDAEAGFNALKALATEMERRRELEVTNISEFNLLPRIVCVIDEFPALVSGMGDSSKLLTTIVSSILQRGRHYKIHLVLAAQNPTIQNMKVDLSNITARMAFTCAKPNFSEIIIGEKGAEKLSGNGDMLYKSPQHDTLQRIQGAYISPSELKQVLYKFAFRNRQIDNPYKFVIDEETLRPTEMDSGCYIAAKTSSPKGSVEDKLFAQVIMWALERETISSNSISDTFSVGWRRAKKFLDRLYSLEIAGNLDAKLPRAVLPTRIEDLSSKAVDILVSNGYTEEQARETLLSKEIMRELQFEE